MSQIKEKEHGLRVVVTGGGTGGHVTPIKPVAVELKNRGHDILYVGQKSDAFADIVTRETDLITDSKLIQAGKYRRYPNQSILVTLFDIKTNLLNIRDLFRTATGYVQARRYLAQNQVEAVFAKGGYVTLPVGMAASHLDIPLVIHESDTVAGLANRTLSSRATYIAVTAEPKNYKFPRPKTIQTGLPISLEYAKNKLALNEKQRREGKKKLGLDADLPLLVVTGGSLGAKFINDLMMKREVNQTILKHYQVVHITGRAHFDEIHRKVQSSVYKVIGLTDILHEYFKLADVAVARASATTMAELSACAVPVVIIPASQLSDQVNNAKILNREKRAIAISENDLEKNPGRLAETLKTLSSDKELYNLIQNNMRESQKPDAHKAVVDLIEQAAQSKDKYDGR